MLATVNTQTSLPGEIVLAMLEERGWSQAELARRAGHHRAVIHGVVTGRRNIGRDLGISIASAFDMPPETFFRKIGLFPEDIEADSTLEQIEHLYTTLQSEQSKQQALEYMHFLKTQEERGTYANPKRTITDRKK